jgi:hypothetical protein
MVIKEFWKPVVLETSQGEGGSLPPGCLQAISSTMLEFVLWYHMVGCYSMLLCVWDVMQEKEIQDKQEYCGQEHML